MFEILEAPAVLGQRLPVDCVELLLEFFDLFLILRIVEDASFQEVLRHAGFNDRHGLLVEFFSECPANQFEFIQRVSFQQCAVIHADRILEDPEDIEFQLPGGFF